MTLTFCNLEFNSSVTAVAVAVRDVSHFPNSFESTQHLSRTSEPYATTAPYAAQSPDLKITQPVLSGLRMLEGPQNSCISHCTSTGAEAHHISRQSDYLSS